MEQAGEVDYLITWRDNEFVGRVSLTPCRRAGANRRCFALLAMRRCGDAGGGAACRRPAPSCPCCKDQTRRVRHHSWMPTTTVLLKMVEAFGTGDVARVDQFVSPDYVDHQGLGEGEVRGASGFANVVQVARRAVSGLEVRIEDVITEDDRVAARINWQGVSADGRMVERETIDIIRVVDDKAVEHWGAEMWSRSSDPSR